MAEIKYLSLYKNDNGKIFLSYELPIPASKSMPNFNRSYKSYVILQEDITLDKIKEHIDSLIKEVEDYKNNI